MADLPNTWTLGLKSRIVWLCLMILVYAVLTVFVFRNFIPQFGSTLIGPPEDNMQDFWNTWYAMSQVRAFRDLGYTNLIKYPEGTTLYYNAFSYPKIVTAIIFGKLFGTRLPDLVLLENLFLLISFPISAIGGFYLARHFTRDRIGAMVAGAVFAFNPSHVAHVGHQMHVSSIEFIPFFALSFILAVERRSRLSIVLSTLCFALTALSSWYYLFYCAYFMAFYYAFVAIKRRRWLQVWPLVVILCNILGVCVLLSPLLVPMVVQEARGLSVYQLSQPGADTYVADLVGYVTFPRVHLLAALTKQISSHLSGNPWEATVYLGLVNIALLVWLIVHRKQLNRELIIFVLTGMGLFSVFASGNHLHVLGLGDGHIPSRLSAVHHLFVVPIPHLLLRHLPYLLSHFRIPLPDLLLSYLPFFKNVRTPSRAIVFVYMFLSIGVGYAVSVIWQRRDSTWVGRALVVAIVFLMALDWYPRPLPGTPRVCLPAYSLVTQDPDRHAAVLDLPRGYLDTHYIEGEAYMMYQTCHLHPIVNGIVSRILNKTLEDQLITDDLDQQRRQLTDNKVKYIVIHRPHSDLFQWSPNDGQIVQYLKMYPVVYSAEDAIVLRVY